MEYEVIYYLKTVALACVALWAFALKGCCWVPSPGTFWVAGQVPSWACGKSNELVFLSHISISLPLPPFASLKINKV